MGFCSPHGVSRSLFLLPRSNCFPTQPKTLSVRAVDQLCTVPSQRAWEGFQAEAPPLTTPQSLTGEPRRAPNPEPGLYSFCFVSI